MTVAHAPDQATASPAASVPPPPSTGTPLPSTSPESPR
jgi:hypothetical protein